MCTGVEHYPPLQLDVDPEDVATDDEPILTELPAASSSLPPTLASCCLRPCADWCPLTVQIVTLLSLHECIRGNTLLHLAADYEQAE